MFMTMENLNCWLSLKKNKKMNNKERELRRSKYSKKEKLTQMTII